MVRQDRVHDFDLRAWGGGGALGQISGTLQVSSDGGPSQLGDELSSIYVMESDGANQTRLEVTSGGIEPAWSPDAACLAFISYNGGNGSQVYVTEADSRNLMSLTSDSNYKSSPSWSNVGR